MAAGAVLAPLIIPIIHLQTRRAKNHINTNTPISIHSDVPGVQLFFTLDGSRPAPVQRGSAGSRSRKYSEPILLPAGQVTVRAIAVTSDGRQSSTVTKIFLVDLVDSDNMKDNKENQQRPSEGTSWSAVTSAGSSLRPPEPRMMGNASPPPGVRSLSGRPPSAISEAKQPSSTNTSRVQRQTDFLRCARCLSLRPSDPFAGFCAQCGAAVPPLPEQRLPPAEGGQVLCCLFCNTLVPVNSQSCLICEASIHQQLHPQSSLTLQDHVVCVSCGSGNPAHVSSCLTCESRLQTVCAGNSAPSVPSAGGRMLSCSRCKRVNQPDARFCDWCGSKPGHAASCVLCWRCGASGHPYAFHCTACGVFLEAPPSSVDDITPPTGGATTNQATASHDATWQATPSFDPTHMGRVTTPTSERCTQTVGLYYPSATGLKSKEQQRELSRQQTRDRQPLLTSISPGRGYWRKQLDHICAHLRSYAQNNAPFRALLGEPRLGRMVSAVLQEDRSEVSVTFSFVSARQEEKQVDPAGGSVAPAAGQTETLSSVTERAAAGCSLRSDLVSGVTKPPKPNLTPKPPTTDVQLLKELGPGRGQISVVQQLLDQGADPSCCDSDGRHALAVAVVNGHHDVLPVLVQRGADVDQQSGRMKNSALHEAAALGSEGLRSAKVLLSCRADMRRRNAGGQTAYDMAVDGGCNDTASLLAAQVGLDLLGKLGRTKVKLDC